MVRRAPHTATGRWRIEVVDTWGMMITPLEGAFAATDTIPMPRTQYIALYAHRLALGDDAA